MSEGLYVMQHPFARHWAQTLCNQHTSREEFRLASDRLARLIANEVLSSCPTSVTQYASLVTKEDGACWFEGGMVETTVTIVPILRSGMVMVDAFLDLCPWATVGAYGFERDECTAFPVRYYGKVPDELGGLVIVVDPMLATGGSAIEAVRDLVETRDVLPTRIHLACAIAAEEGIDALVKAFPGVRITTAMLGSGLNGKKFIIGGPGDFGDRYWGTTAGKSGLI